jgi:hypothetical protein
MEKNKNYMTPREYAEKGTQWTYVSNLKRWQVISYFLNLFELKIGVELGVNRGENFFNLLEINKKLLLYGVDVFEPQKDNVLEDYGGIENLTSYKEIVFQKLKKYPNRAQIFVERTDQAYRHFDDFELDFVFIDADHSYKSVKKDIKLWKNKVKEHGLIMGHDFNWGDVSRAVGESFKEVWLCSDNTWIASKHWLRK